MRFPAASPILPALLFAAVTACTLTTGQRAAIVSIEGALCSALLPLAWPGGGSADALVCAGSEGVLSAALASLPAPGAQPALTPQGGGSGPPPALVRRPVHARGKLVGFVPESIATDVQRRLDAQR